MVSGFRTLWRRESWYTRILLTLGLLLGILSAVNVTLLAVIGFLGRWDFGALGREISWLYLVGLGFGYVYWRRRALDARLSPTQVVVDYGTPGAAAIARHVEELMQRDADNAQESAEKPQVAP